VQQQRRGGRPLLGGAITACLAAVMCTTSGLAANPPARFSLIAPHTIVTDVGRPVTFTLRATAQGTSSIHIGGLLLPQGATLSGNDGNPAEAVVRWRPSRSGVFIATFTAQSVRSHEGIAGTVTIRVRTAPVAVSNVNATSYWGFLLGATPARSAPSSAAPVVAQLTTRTPEDTQNLVLVLSKLMGAGGPTWYRVRLPVLPNGSTGWIPAGVLGQLHSVDTHLVVDRQRLVATLYRNGKSVFSTPVGVGQDRYPTPAGNFYVRDLVRSYGDAFYGPLAYGTSARSRVLTEWPAGGYIGIHGTNQPNLIPGRISHGCVRIQNAALLTLHRLMPIGTPITIR
jgi:L,D-transpeptidase catalytic domain